MRMHHALIVLALLLFAAVGAVLAGRPRPVNLTAAIRQVAVDHPSVTLSAAELSGMPTTSRLVVDVRPSAEWSVSHLPGAFRSEDADAVIAEAHRRRLDRIVVYCSIGVRSSRMAERLRAAQPQLGIADLSGGIFTWASENRPLVDDAGRPTRLVHPYDATWGTLLPADRRAPLP